MTEATSSPPDNKPPAVGVLGVGLLVLAFAIAILGLMPEDDPPSDVDHSKDVAEMFGGAEVVKTIQEPDRVTAQRMRLLPSDEQTDAEGGFARVNYKPMTEPVTVSDSIAHELASVLTSGSSYEWYDGIIVSKSCMPTYGVKLSFDRGDRHVDAWLCFECKVFAVFEPIEYETSQDASGYGNFDLVHDGLADIMQALFPDDEAIGAL